MGCAVSKIDDSEAVALCRDRSRLLADAIAHRYALADAHAAYCRSLHAAGESLHRFLNEIQSLPLPPSPLLPLPAHRKGDNLPASSSPPHSRSNSGSHIHFHSDDSDSDDDFPLHSDDSSPIHFHHDDEPQRSPAVNFNYARSQPPAPSVSYEQRPMSPEAVRYVNGGGGGGESSYSYYGDGYPQNPNFNAYPYGYSSGYPSYGEMGGFFGSSSPPAGVPVAPVGGRAGSPSSKAAPPPPPSPPRASTWDFLNPFEGFESYYAPYTPSRSSKEVREEEGIPDLEEEEHEVVKEAYGDEKSVASTSTAATSKPEAATAATTSKGEGSKGLGADAESTEKVEDGLVHKNVVADEVGQPEEQQNVAAFPPSKRYNGVAEVVSEIKNQFDRASESANEVSKMLEVGKLQYHRRNSVYKVPSRMICGAIPPLAPKCEAVVVFEEDKAMGSGNLSSTLQKLYIWEKKLYDEVMVEEKMRVVHDRKCKRLKHLDERGAEAHKLESTQASIRKLATKIRIAIQVVDSISNKISKLRDEELWPQISELIYGLMRMWRAMLECHQTQCQALSEAKNLDSIASGGKMSDAHIEATKQLELVLLDLITSFSAWVHAQKSYVSALNGWLFMGLRYVPEETPDGIVPFSPGRLGAPPVFVICHQWAQTMDRISEKEVVDAMHGFASSVLHLWEQHNFEQRQRLMANRDMDKTLRIMEREEQEMRRAVEAQNKKLVLVSGQSGLAISGQAASSLQLCLRQVFEALQNFTASAVNVYEELHMRAEEEKLARENTEVL